MFRFRKSMISVLIAIILAFCVGACGLIEKQNFNELGSDIPYSVEVGNNPNYDFSGNYSEENKEDASVTESPSGTPVSDITEIPENSNDSEAESGENQGDLGEVVDGTEKNDVDGSSGIVMPGFSNNGEADELVTKETDPLESYYEMLESGYEPMLVISEVMSSNKSYSPVEGEYYDWVELYNNSDVTINLSEFYLTDNIEKTRKYQLPNVELKSGKYYVIYCSGLDIEGHASFKISSEGESLYLYNCDTICDYVEVPSDLQKDKSYGRYKNELLYIDTPTPGKKNKKGYDHAFVAPEANLASGLYYEPIEVELSGEGTIYYTLDGSRPSSSSAKYSSPITIDGVATIRTYCVQGDRVSEYASYTYLVDVEHTLPVVTISIPEEYLYGENGIIEQFSQTIEKEAVMTLIEDGEEKFSVPCGFRLHGNDSRKGAKQNFQIRFRSKYGVGKLHYKLFDNSEIDEFNSLLLKGGSEDYRYAMIRDEFCTGLVNGTTELNVLECKPCVLYIAGQYWGIYYIRERFSADYVASHYDVSKESVDLLYTMGLAQDGSSKEYSSLVNYVKTHDLSVDEYYQYVIDRVDITSLMDWYICRSYMGDKDYANVRYFKSSEYDNKWRYCYFDLDWAFWTSQDTPVTAILGNTNLNAIIYNLLANSEFRIAFVKRYAELMNTILNEEYITAKLDEFIAVIEDEMPRDRERWGYRMSDWKEQINKIYRINSDGARTANVLKDIQDFFDLTDKQMKKYFKGKYK